MNDEVCGYCGEEGGDQLVCAEGHEYCEGCTETACDWCVRQGKDSSGCPACEEVWCLDLGDFVCMKCVEEALSEGVLRYCTNHGQCYVRMPPSEELPSGLDSHADCDTIGHALIVRAKLQEVWKTLQ